MEQQVFKLMVEHEGYPYIEMDDLTLEEAQKEQEHREKLFPENNYWVEESSGSVPASELRFIPRDATDGWEDLYPDYER